MGATTRNMRGTAEAVIKLRAEVDGERIALHVDRSYTYARPNHKGECPNKVEVLSPKKIVFVPDSMRLGKVWMDLFDLASQLELSRPADRHWLVFSLSHLPERGRGAVEMLVQSIAEELGFPVTFEYAEEQLPLF